MSYCRFSSDNFGCDLYCYEDYCGGWTTHVASNRHIGEIPKIPNFDNSTAEEWVAASKAQSAFLENCERESIGLPHDGAWFNDETLEEFQDRVKYLLGLGYRGRPGLLECIEEEVKEAKGSL